MRFNTRLALFSVLACGILVGGAAIAIAQTRPTIFRPVVPRSSNVRTVGAVDPVEQIDIVVTNSLEVALGIGFSGGANLEVAPGDSAKVSFAAPPVNLFLYPLAATLSTRSRIAIDENTINVEVISVTSVAPGDVSLNVDGVGTVYVY